MEDQPVGEDNEHCVHTQRGEHYKEAIGTIDVGVGTGQLHDIWVQAVGVRKLVIAAVRQLLQHDGGRDVETDAAHHDSQAQAGNPGTCEDGAIAQRVADGNHTVKGHGQQHRGLHDGEGVDEEELSQTHVHRHLPETQHVDSEHGGQSGGRQAQVSHC